MRKLSILYLCFFCFEAFSIGNGGSKAWNTGDFYFGDPCSKDLRTYVNLCRKTAGSENECYNPDKFDGLSVAFITTDGEFCGFDPNETKNIVWSASACLGGNGFKIRYVYNYERYKDSGEEIIEYGDGITGLPDSDKYLHNLDGSRCVSDTVSNCYAEGSELRIVRTLRTALFRWEIPGKKLSDILKLMGKVGERREIKDQSANVIPEYRLSGPDAFLDPLKIMTQDRYGISHNCATFSAKIIREIIGVTSLGGELATSSLMVPGVGCSIATVAAAGAFFLPGGPVLTAVYSLIGLSGSVITVGGLSLTKYFAYLNTPNGVINGLLGFYVDDIREFVDLIVDLKNKLVEKSGNAVTIDDTWNFLREHIDTDETRYYVKVLYERTRETVNNDNYKIVAHDLKETKDHCRSKRIDSYKNFELKSAKEAVVSKLKMGELKRENKNWLSRLVVDRFKKKDELIAFLENIFLKSDFDKSSLGDIDSVITFFVCESNAINDNSDVTVSNSDSVDASAERNNGSL